MDSPKCDRVCTHLDLCFLHDYHKFSSVHGVIQLFFRFSNYLAWFFSRFCTIQCYKRYPVNGYEEYYLPVGTFSAYFPQGCSSQGVSRFHGKKGRRSFEDDVKMQRISLINRNLVRCVWCSSSIEASVWCFHALCMGRTSIRLIKSCSHRIWWYVVYWGNRMSKQRVGGAVECTIL